MSARQINGKLAPKFNPFEDNYLSEVLEATATAWTRMKKPGRREIEDKITFRLAGRLANDPQFADMPYEIVPQYWLLGLHGQRLGRLDLRFRHRSSQRDYFAFEAKRLHVTYPGGAFGAEYSTYAGREGMMAFVKGQYSKGLPACGMLGYVMDGKSDGAWKGLERRINSRRKHLRLVAGSTLAQSLLANAVASLMNGIQLGETQHDLSTHQLRVFHMLLPIN